MKIVETTLLYLLDTLNILLHHGDLHTVVLKLEQFNVIIAPWKFL